MVDTKNVPFSFRAQIPFFAHFNHALKFPRKRPSSSPRIEATQFDLIPTMREEKEALLLGFKIIANKLKLILQVVEFFFKIANKPDSVIAVLATTTRR